jgi:hypothetical protein
MTYKKTHFVGLLVFPKVLEFNLFHTRKVFCLTTVHNRNIPEINCGFGQSFNAI